LVGDRQSDILCLFLIEKKSLEEEEEEEEKEMGTIWIPR